MFLGITPVAVKDDAHMSRSLFLAELTIKPVLIQPVDWSG
jgi:hypothetical protein